MGGYSRGQTRPTRPSSSASASDDLPDAASDSLPEEARPAHTPPPAAAPRVPASPPPPAADSKDEVLRKRIEERAPVAMGSDLFARLGLKFGATRDQVKQAFVEAAQLFHPDHLPASLASLASVQRDIFTALKEAYDILGDDNRRRAYEASAKAAAVAAAAPPVDPREEQAKIAAYQG